MSTSDRAQGPKSDREGAPRIEAVLTDIEGTTTSLAFVKEVLFPYARQALPAYVRARRREPRVAAALDAVRAHEGDSSLGEDAILDRLGRWIDEDRKITALKTLQGYIWEDGYRAGAFRGHVYEDAAVALRRWHADGVRLYVFSSGSIAAQRLLFGHSDFGDLTGLFRDFFDTTTGPKRVPASYAAIAAAVETSPEAILFLSDTAEELDAAHAAGMATIGVDRHEGSNGIARHPRARSFDDVARWVERRHAQTAR